VGAAAGSVRQRVMITVTQPSEGRFRVHLPEGPKDVNLQDEALQIAREAADAIARKRAEAAGAEEISLTQHETIKEVDLGDGNMMFIEAQIQSQAAGMPSA